MELENMTGQVAQDLEDDEHSTNLEKLTIASGHARTPVHQGIFSRATWTYLTSRRRCARRKRDPPTSIRQLHDHDQDYLHDTTTRDGALMIHHLGWIITPVGPVKDTHDTLGPLRREAVGGPTTRPKGEASDNDAPQEHHKREVFRQTH